MDSFTNRPRALAGDIGGTRARFAFCDLDGSNIGPVTSLLTREHASLDEALARVMTGEARPDIVSLAVAAPVTNGRIELTNASWSFTAADVRRATGAGKVNLFNDFRALARVLPRLTSDDLKTVASGHRDPLAPCIVLGAGTGFGAASYVRTRAGWEGLPGEGGHMTFGATDADERLVHAHLAEAYRHVSVERVLSGSGLEATHAAFGGDAASSEQIVARAAAGGDPPATRTVDLFVRVLGRVAGDMALMLGARGGVYVGGGIAPHMLASLDSDTFRTAFRNKGRLSAYLSEIPVHVITAPDAGVRGAAVALADFLTDADCAGWAHR